MKHTGFTLVELVVVIVILGIISVVAAPRFLDISTDAKKVSLNNIASQIKATNKIIKARALIKGLIATDSVPSNISDYVIDFGFGSVEVSHKTLCAEAIGELGDDLAFKDFLNLDESGSLLTSSDNQYFKIGYELPSSGAPTNQGCYVFFDSFKTDCPVTVVDADC